MRLPHNSGLLGKKALVPSHSSHWSAGRALSNVLRRRLLNTAAPASGVRDMLRVSSEVSDAIAGNKPVVALESTIYTHGALGKDLAHEHAELVRSNGGVPAIIAIIDGVPKVGVSPAEIVGMIENGNAVKVSRRDISYLVGMGLTGRKIYGGTTIAGTMLLARLAGIRVFGTGGLGGVHRGGESSMDVSADLTELGRTRVAVVSSGCKGFLDITRTLEYLETQGCLVSTFADGRSGEVDFPAFWARDSGVKSPSVVYTEEEAAAMILAQEKLGIESGMLFANPIPEEFGIPAAEMRTAIQQAVAEADEKGFSGASNTPFILGRLKELTGDKVVVANKALVKSNIVRATNVAVELSRLLKSNGTQAGSSDVMSMPQSQGKLGSADPKADILVAGSVAIDLSCDYSSPKAGNVVPKSHTSNPASITQAIGGVGHNVALAAHLASRRARVKLYSMVGDDVAGATILSSLASSGIDTTYVQKLDQAQYPGSRTAQYVAINDGSKNLVMAMADMAIFGQHTLADSWRRAVAATDPKWLVVDGNWSATGIRAWIKAAKEHGSRVAFEPVSMEKSRLLFCPPRGQSVLDIFPNASVDMASPNTYELEAMYSAAKENGYLDSAEWFEIIDSFGMRGARDRFVRLASVELTDAGVPVQSVQLLPYIPTILTKLGSSGVLLTALLGKDDSRLRDRDEDQYILTRASGHPAVGGVYMRLYPPAEQVEHVVSVNGVGDTFMGVMVSGLAQGGSVEKLVDVAQRGAVYSLKHQGSVSSQVSLLEGDLAKAALNQEI